MGVIPASILGIASPLCMYGTVPLEDYEKGYHTGMDVDYICQQLYAYTAGYPFLVSRLCKIIDEQVAGTKECPDRASAWTKEGFQAAIKLILYESNTLFDDMRKNLMNIRICLK